MIFSQRYHRALTERRLEIILTVEVRSKIRTCIEKFNTSIGIQRDPNDSWISNSSATEEAVSDLLTEQGWDDVPGSDFVHQGEPYKAFKHLMQTSWEAHVYDFVELALHHMSDNDREKCRVKINQILDLHQCPWRIADGEFFKLDSDFMGERLSSGAHDALAKNNFDGAAQEYARARQDIASGDAKDAIFYAGKSFESVMKVLTGRASGNADQLIKALRDDGYFDDLPEDFRSGFCEQVLKSLPTLRNKLGGHGQGKTVVAVPAIYGELSIQMAAAFHNFMISKHLERLPPPAEKLFVTSPSALEDEIPF